VSSPRRLLLGPLLRLASCAAFAAACGNSSVQKTGDSGTTRDSGTVNDSGSGDEFPLTCTPNLDVSKATVINPSTTQFDLACLSAPIPGGLVVVDSDSSLAALFSLDAGNAAGNDCPPLPTGIDYTTLRVVVVAPAGAGGGLFDTLSVYQSGTTTVFDVYAQNYGPIEGGSEAWAVVVSTAAATSAKLMVCLSTCTSECPD